MLAFIGLYRLLIVEIFFFSFWLLFLEKLIHKEKEWADDHSSVATNTFYSLFFLF